MGRRWMESGGEDREPFSGFLAGGPVAPAILRRRWSIQGPRSGASALALAEAFGVAVMYFGSLRPGICGGSLRILFRRQGRGPSSVGLEDEGSRLRF